MKPLYRKSFTLVEVLVSTIIFIIFIIAFLTALWTSFNYLRRVMELRTASLILQEEVSIVRNLDFSEILSMGDTFSSSAMSSLENASGSIVKSSYNSLEEILRITFKIDWTTFDGKQATKTLVTLITDHGIDKK